MIRRDPGALANHRFDLAVVGGGIQGASLALEAARRGLRVALVERSDFGAGSSGNSLRILHGGLRYLQSLDFLRFRESVAARGWFVRRFPRLVRPLPCLMPLYGTGLKRSPVMRAALALNDVLSADRNRNLPEALHLPAGRVLRRAETLELFPSVRAEGLTGAALWYDYQMIGSERILIEMLGQACALGAVAANYVEATRFVVREGRVAGVVCTDRTTGDELRVDAPVVVSCAGPACAALAERAGSRSTGFAPSSVAFNVLFESDGVGAHAMAVAAPGAGAPVHFVCPSRHGLWAGTAHVARPNRPAELTAPTELEVEQFVAALRRAVPAFGWSGARVRRVYWGALPVRREATVDLTARPEIVAHPEARGLFSVVGIKFTTAPQVAARTLRRVFGAELPRECAEPFGRDEPSSHTDVLLDGDRAAGMAEADLRRMVESVASDEAVFDVDDWMLRRTNWMFTAGEPGRLRAAVQSALPRAFMAAPPLGDTMGIRG